MAVMKTSDEIRRENLELAVKRIGSAAKLAEAAATSPAYISQIRNKAPDSKTGKAKMMGDDMARRIEAAIGEASGWLDTPHSTGSVSAYDVEDGVPDDMVLVKESRVEFSAGPGKQASFELVEDSIPASYRRDWFQKEGMNPDKVKRFRVAGRSMEPYLFAQDTILVNTGETNIVDGKLYAIRYGDELRVKYLSRRLDGTLILRSVNADYKDEEVPPELVQEHIDVIGRVRDRSGRGGL